MPSNLLVRSNDRYIVSLQMIFVRRIRLSRTSYTKTYHTTRLFTHSDYSHGVFSKRPNQPRVFPSHSIPSRPNQPINRAFPNTASKPAEINPEISQGTTSKHWLLHSVRVRVWVGWSTLGTTAKTPGNIHYQDSTTAPIKIRFVFCDPLCGADIFCLLVCRLPCNCLLGGL